MNENIVTLRIEIPGMDRLITALESLAGNGTKAPAGTHTAPVQPGVQAGIPAMPQPTAPVQPQQVPVTQNSMPGAPLQQQAVPTTAVSQEFSYDQLAVAAAGLVNQGRQEKLFGVLRMFGVNAMTELPKERYGEFAAALRTEGAVI